MKKVYLFFLLLLSGLLSKGIAQTRMQEDSMLVRAKQIYGFVMTGQGDSVHVRLNHNLQAKLVPATFNDIFRQMENQMGKRVSEGEWKKETAAGITLYYCDVKFTNYSLRFITAFDADGKANTIRFTPVPAQAVADTASVAFDKEKIQERAIHIQSGKFTLPGTLTLPKNGEKLALIILVHGSGPNDRDETIGPNKPFRDIAWGLAEQGIAVLRYDKRTKVYGAEAFPKGEECVLDNEVTEDVLAAIRMAAKLPEINPDKIFVLGHSLGGMMAPRIAECAEKESRMPDAHKEGKKALAGIIILAGNARPFEDLLVDQIAYISSITDSSDAGKAKVDEIKLQVANVKKLGKEGFDEKIPLPLNMPRAYWQSINDYKQVEVAARLKLPILILQGERDYQVTMEDFGLWRFGLFRNKNVQFKSYSKLNHILQEGNGKSTPFEYNYANPVPVYVIKDIATFVNGKSVN